MRLEVELKTALENLKAYQDVLNRVADLESLLSKVPEEIQVLEEKWKSDEKRLAELKASMASQEAKIKEIEHDLEAANQQAKKFDTDLSAVTNSKEYNAVLKEIDATRKKITNLTEELAEIRRDVEQLRINIEDDTQLAAESKANYEEAMKTHRASQTDFLSELKEKTSERDALAEKLSKAQLRQFDRIASRRNGVGLALCQDSICSACNVRIRPNVVEALRRKDRIIQCESCQRILYFDDETPE